MFSNHKLDCLLRILIFGLCCLYAQFVWADKSQLQVRNLSWLKSEKAIYKLKTERQILVNVKALKKNSQSKKLVLTGAGWVRKSLSETFAIAQKYELLTQVSEHIVKSNYSAESRELFLRLQAYNYSTDMWLKMESAVGSNPEELKRLHFNVVKGVFKNMKGALLFRKIDINQTQMEIQSEFEYKSLPMPDFFLEFALEVVMQQVASKMRTFIENYSLKN